METIALVRIHGKRLVTWHLENSSKRLLAPFVGTKLDIFKALQGQPLVPARQLAVWARVIGQLKRKDGASYAANIIDQDASSLALWNYEHVIFFMDGANAQETLKAAQSLCEQDIHIAIVSQGYAFYQANAGYALRDVKWMGLDAKNAIAFLEANADEFDASKPIVPDWQATRLGDYCPYFVPVSIGRRGDAHVVPREVDAVMAEIEALKASGVLTDKKRILFDAPFADEGVARLAIKAIAERLVTAKYIWAAWLPSGFDASEIALLRRSGLCLAFLGKSMDFEGLMNDSNGKIVKSETVQAFKDAGVCVSVEVILGHDEQSIDAFDDARRLLSKGVDIPSISVYTPMPEMPEFSELESEMRITTYDWTRYDGHHIVFKPKALNPKTIENRYAVLQGRISSGLRAAMRFMKLGNLRCAQKNVLEAKEASALRLALSMSTRINEKL